MRGSDSQWLQTPSRLSVPTHLFGSSSSYLLIASRKYTVEVTEIEFQIINYRRNHNYTTKKPKCLNLKQNDGVKYTNIRHKQNSYLKPYQHQYQTSRIHTQIRGQKRTSEKHEMQTQIKIYHTQHNRKNSNNKGHQEET